jgi:hypothetical protein
LDRSVLSALLKPGTIAFVQGVHLFNSETSDTVGPGQVAKGRRTANNVTVHYVFDLWGRYIGLGKGGVSLNAAKEARRSQFEAEIRGLGFKPGEGKKKPDRVKISRPQR